MHKDTVKKLRSRLEAEQDALQALQSGSAESRRPVELDQQSVGRLSRMDAMQVQAMANATDSRRKARMKAIEAALARMDEGEYGYCTSCGEEIAPRRLETDPAAARCVDCA